MANRRILFAFGKYMVRDHKIKAPSFILSKYMALNYVNSRRWLNLQEYQSKQMMQDNQITVQRFKVMDSISCAKDTLCGNAPKFSCNEYVVKAQVLAGGRSKGHFKGSGMKGGVKLTKDPNEAVDFVGKMLQDHLVTDQTTKDGVLVQKVMVAEALDIQEELYLAILLDRVSGGPCFVVSKYGGVDIEEVAKKNPDSIKKYPISIDKAEVDASFAEKIAKEGLEITDPGLIMKAVKEIQSLYCLFLKIDATQVEINPLGITPENQVVCFDAKIQFDENAEFRQSWIKGVREENKLESDPRETLAKKYQLSFVPMNGSIGCLVNGAGLAMATMDIIHHYGGEPANFLDVGGGVNQMGVENAFRLITSDPKVRAIFVNIFGGIVNCETIAKGLIAAIDMVKVPLIVRLEGTNQESAMHLLDSVPSIISSHDLDDAAYKAVKAASTFGRK